MSNDIYGNMWYHKKKRSDTMARPKKFLIELNESDVKMLQALIHNKRT